MSMKNKGLTLIEVIVSLAIFAIISVGFYGMFSVVFVNTFRTSAITEETFRAQKIIEDQIATIKGKILNNEVISDFNIQDYVLFVGTTQERTLQAYVIEHHGSSGLVLETLVSETRVPPLIVPVVEPFKISGYYSSGSSIVRTINPNTTMSNLSINIDGDLTVDNPGMLIRFLYYWYVSDSSTFVPGDEPIFPDQYEIIPGQTNRLLTTVPTSYAGKFVKLVVTPVGEKGRMGVPVESNSLYISPFTQTQNLLLRLDASYLNENDNNQTIISGNNINVIRWTPTYPENVSESSAALSPPQLKTYYRTDSGVSMFKTLFREGTSRSVSTTNVSSANGNQTLTVYAILKFPSTIGSTTQNLIQGGGASGTNRWQLQLNSGNLRLSRFTGANSTERSASTPSSLNFKDGEMKVVKLYINTNSLRIDVDGLLAVNQSITNSTNSLNSTPMIISLSQGIEISEILVYSGIHNKNSSEELSVYDYFIQKYLFPETIKQ